MLRAAIQQNPVYCYCLQSCPSPGDASCPEHRASHASRSPTTPFFALLCRNVEEVSGNLSADPFGQVCCSAQCRTAARTVSVLHEGLPPLDDESVRLGRTNGKCWGLGRGDAAVTWTGASHSSTAECARPSAPTWDTQTAGFSLIRGRPPISLQQLLFKWGVSFEEN